MRGCAESKQEVGEGGGQMAKEVTLQLGKHSRREAQQVQRPRGQRERAAGMTSTKGSGGPGQAIPQ